MSFCNIREIFCARNDAFKHSLIQVLKVYLKLISKNECKINACKNFYMM